MMDYFWDHRMSSSSLPLRMYFRLTMLLVEVYVVGNVEGGACVQVEIAYSYWSNAWWWRIQRTTNHVQRTTTFTIL